MVLAPPWTPVNDFSLDGAMLAVGFLVVGIVASFVAIRLQRLSKFPPPGPRGFKQSPTSRSIFRGRKDIWRQYAEWSKIYGPVFSFRSHRLNIVVLNSAKAVHDLLDIRAKIYSDRPYSAIIELTNQNKPIGRISSQDARFATSRRMAHEELGQKGTLRHLPALERHVKLLLKSLMSDPKHFRQHLRLCQSKSIMMAIYGYPVESDDDPYITIHGNWFKALNSPFLRTGAWFIDSYPILRYLPTWMLGAESHNFITERRASNGQMMNVPFEWTKSEIRAGRSYPSFVANQLSQDNVNPDHEESIKYVVGAMHMSGVDTVLSAMLTFLLMMMLNPEIQKRAQEEVDSVVGSDRLPQLPDRGKLPYVGALIQEVLRFHPPAPLAVTHAVTQDDYYEDMFIQKGSTIVPNVWAVTHDESTYPEPMKFDPMRYLDKSDQDVKSAQPDPRNFVFGFGRRVCAGMYFAEVTLFLQVSSILATFNISKEMNTDGVEIIPNVDFTGGHISQPEDFVCRIVPRSDAAIDLIMWDH
ncbi:cytochrome P450 [Sistotremastrum suecicum HHB10207 ss-3]|uniref:Cytochrome P450 n=1 Tax=Sistotremastrum suecicum HHB10207 ss-3 TaxID=1314776 RepID=A0A166A030_9AGAM|nr:cytochrome P450 [Sistotremastrum suecicum HHB10207 ss-3]